MPYLSSKSLLHLVAPDRCLKLSIGPLRCFWRPPPPLFGLKTVDSAIMFIYHPVNRWFGCVGFRARERLLTFSLYMPLLKRFQLSLSFVPFASSPHSRGWTFHTFFVWSRGSQLLFRYFDMVFKDSEFLETTATATTVNTKSLSEQDKADMANLGKPQRFNVIASGKSVTSSQLMCTEKFRLPLNARIYDDLDELIGSRLYVHHPGRMSIRNSDLSKETIQRQCIMEGRSLWCTAFSFAGPVLWWQEHHWRRWPLCMQKNFGGEIPLNMIFKGSNLRWTVPLGYFSISTQILRFLKLVHRWG